MTIIEVNPREDGGHGLQSQSGRTSCWLEGWIEVPAELDSAVWDSLGWCDLTIEDGKLTSITPTEKPDFPEPPHVITQDERISALESAMLSMMEVSADV